MRNNFRRFNTAIMTVGLMLISACAPLATQSPTQTSASQQPPIASNQQTATPTSTMVPTASPEKAETPTALPSPTPPEEVILQPIGKTNCRSLPYATSRVVGYLRNGVEATAVGKDARGEWFLIQNPDKKDGTFCWVSATTVQTSGDPALLPFKSAVQK